MRAGLVTISNSHAPLTAVDHDFRVRAGPQRSEAPHLISRLVHRTGPDPGLDFESGGAGALIGDQGCVDGWSGDGDAGGERQEVDRGVAG
jgi:hypothetical protein